MKYCIELTWFERYLKSLILGILLAVALFISIFYLKEFSQFLSPIIGLLFSVPISLFWFEYKSPILQIKKKPDTAIFHIPKMIKGDEPTPRKVELSYNCFRIVVENKGRSSVNKCKGYLIVDGETENDIVWRVCWIINKERSTVSINVKDNEFLDFIAFYEGMKGDENITVPNIVPIIAPTEDGWGNPPRDASNMVKCKVLITAKNAKPVTADIYIDKKRKEIRIL